MVGSQNSSVGLFGMNHSMGDGMGGMLTKSELSTLKSLSGLKIRNFGEAIVIVQTAEIEQMKEMLNQIGV
jgi:hypothetical protein